MRRYLKNNEGIVTKDVKRSCILSGCILLKLSYNFGILAARLGKSESNIVIWAEQQTQMGPQFESDTLTLLVLQWWAELGRTANTLRIKTGASNYVFISDK